MFKKNRQYSRQQCLTSFLSNGAIGLLLAIFGGGKLVSGAAKEHGMAVFFLVVGAIFVVLALVWLIRWTRAPR